METCVAVDDRSYTDIEAYLTEHGQEVGYSNDRGIGTASAITLAMEQMESSSVLVCNADTIIPENILQLANEFARHLPVLQILTPLSVQNTGLIGVEAGRPSSRVVHWGEATGERPPQTLQPASSSGSYVIDRKFWAKNTDRSCASLELEVMPECARSGAVEAHVARTLLPTFDFGTLDRWARLKRDPNMLSRLFESFGAERPPKSGYCLSGIEFA
jgi:NDP-sugar pyrophosphorylase family protein